MTMESPEWTDEQRAEFARLTQGFPNQDENGVDLSHLRSNLAMTPTERIQKLQRSYEVRKEVARAAILAGLRRHSR